MQPHSLRRRRAAPPLRGGGRAALVFALASAVVLPASGQTPAKPPADTPPVSSTTVSKFGANVTELKTIDQKQGTGDEAVAGKTVVVHYTGWLYDPATSDGHGKKFDKGWDEGVAGMKVGGKRTLVIPPQKGYGERGAGGVIPPNATLLFDVELIEVKK